MHHAGLPRMAFGPGCLLQAALQAYQLAAPQHPGQAGTSDLGHSLPAHMRGTTWLGASSEITQRKQGLALRHCKQLQDGDLMCSNTPYPFM